MGSRGSRASAPATTADRSAALLERAVSMLSEWHRLAEIGTQERWKTGDGTLSITNLWRDLASRQRPFLQGLAGDALSASAHVGSAPPAEAGGSIAPTSSTSNRRPSDTVRDELLAACKAARVEFYDLLHSHMSEQAFLAEPIVEQIDAAISKAESLSSQELGSRDKRASSLGSDGRPSVEWIGPASCRLRPNLLCLKSCAFKDDGKVECPTDGKAADTKASAELQGSEANPNPDQEGK